ncbi:PTS system mannitol-specific EIICBA component, partial [Vibrio parahaemolyticus V-223/04]
KSTFSDIGR